MVYVVCTSTLSLPHNDNMHRYAIKSAILASGYSIDLLILHLCIIIKLCPSRSIHIHMK